MVKRRRVNASQTVRSGGEAREERSRPAPTIDDVSVARVRLRGALHLLLDPADSSGNYDLPKHGHKRKQDDFLTHLKPEQLQARQEEKKAAIAARRKQRRAEMSHVAYHNTFVMKLFDRSVDLAQFKEDTPLYPICRAWMANRPRDAQIKEIKRSTSPVPKPKPEPVDEDPLQNGSGEGIDSDQVTDDDLVKDTYSLPVPLPLTFVRYPICKPEQTSNLDLILNGSESFTKEDLLREHVTNWSEIRNNWMKAANENEDRFSSSRRILKAIYDKAQREFE